MLDPDAEIDASVASDTIASERGRFLISKMRLKDYAYQYKNQIHCNFKYLILMYDQMCDCADESGWEDQLGNCNGDYDSLGLVCYQADRLHTLLSDVNFRFDSNEEAGASPIAKQLLAILHDWCRRITRVRVNTEHIYNIDLTLHNRDMLVDLASNIGLHVNIDDDKFLKQRHLAIDIEVVFTDLFQSDLADIGMNLTYCNYLIFDFLRQSGFYQSCGFYLSCNGVNKGNIPFYTGTSDISAAYCHMYLVPLNLKECYWRYNPAESPDSSSEYD